jgi:hypothetical protein
MKTLIFYIDRVRYLTRKWEERFFTLGALFPGCFENIKGPMIILVDLRGFEPLTSSVRLRRAPNCATGPLKWQTVFYLMQEWMSRIAAGDSAVKKRLLDQRRMPYPKPVPIPFTVSPTCM